ncbi:MAG: hypothetical protein COW65_05805 [Cytophagales bacterium CG18_big_fil_WC_8_21_14_2_50_42_9]|nr:MAG: hypothetical protein COW65_05805 [Cytophagales bacterium CG18_big_fil_WC_8_21_14_2_50_42_9]
MISIVVGLLVVGLGFLVKRYPELIAGYNTMPKSDKERFDIKGFSLLMKKTFIIAGLIIIGFGLMSEINYWSAAAFVFDLIIMLILVVFLNLSAPKYKL